MKEILFLILKGRLPYDLMKKRRAAMDLLNPIITLRDLKKSYDGVNDVLKGINLDIAPGQIIGYIGPNGAGKSTTVKIMIGMIPEFSGEVRVFGLNIATQAQDVKKRIGYVPETAALYETLTPNEFLLFLGRIHEIPEPEIRKRASDMLHLFGLKENADSRMTSFSKGMKQKVLIIASLIHDPDILFLDEPLSGLDANMMVLVKEILSRLAAKGKTIFYCSHVMDVVERVCDRIVIIDKGSIIADGTFDELQGMNKGESLEKIFTQLTGSSGQERLAEKFISVFEEGGNS
jgi:ABC-2 type transport system ATP-binding protein